MSGLKLNSAQRLHVGRLLNTMMYRLKVQHNGKLLYMLMKPALVLVLLGGGAGDTMTKSSL